MIPEALPSLGATENRYKLKGPRIRTDYFLKSLVSSPKSSQKQMKPKDTQKKRADIRLLICSVTICTIFMLLFLPSVLINVIKVTSGSKSIRSFLKLKGH